MDPHRNSTKSRRGFSLTETVIALGLFAFCILPIIGLMPVGMSAARSVEQETQAANLAEAFFGAWQVRPLGAKVFPIPDMFTNPPVPLESTNASVMYFNGEGLQLEPPKGSTLPNGVVPGASMRLDYDVNTDKKNDNTVTIKLGFSWPPGPVQTNDNGVVYSTNPAVQVRNFVRVLPWQ